MGCCGKMQIGGSGAPTAARAPTGRVLFEYHGEGQLNVFGRMTGVRYHFIGPGARVSVDARDAATLAVVRGFVVVPTSAAVAFSGAPAP